MTDSEPNDPGADASVTPVFPEHRIIDTIGVVAWDPYDIWLRRIQQPRATAARAALDKAAA